MMRQRAPRILLASTASGMGKTTLTCGLLAALARRGLRVQACKCGPDYLDPMFHTQVLGIPSRNLDLFLGDEALVRSLVAEGAEGSDLTVIEGAMGLYDGIAQSEEASAYAVARATRTPVLLVVDARGRALSVAAEVAGYARFREPSMVAGVILNHASAGYYPSLKAMVERETRLPVLGYVPTLEEMRLPHRHLGLVVASEVGDLRQRVDALARTLERTLDLGALRDIAESAEPLSFVPRELPERQGGNVRIALAYDEAFNFYYSDALDVLERLGAELVRFSPLRDGRLPEGICGLYLGGGYPELHAEVLSANEALRVQVRDAIAAGLPTIAECGGYLYLHETLEDASGGAWPMVGALTGHGLRGTRLTRFGYATLTAREDSLLARAGERIAVHEFHYWESDRQDGAFHAVKPQSERSWDGGVATDTLYAGFPHLYLPGCPQVAQRFVDACARYAAGQGSGAP